MRAPTRLVLAVLLAGSGPLLSGCQHFDYNEPPKRKFVEPGPQSDSDFPDRVEKVQIGRGGPIGYLRVVTKWMTEEKKDLYEVTWVYDTEFRARGMWMENGDTIRFLVSGHNENLGVLVPAQAFYALLTGQDKFPEEQTTEPEILYLKVEKPRSGFEKPEAAAPEDGGGAPEDAGAPADEAGS